MNYHQKATALEEAANAEAMTVFAEHMNQFKGVCNVFRDIESNLPAIGNDAFKAALLSPGRVIQTDDGTQWQHDLDLTKITSVCHRRTAAGLEFAIVECLPLKSGEVKDVLNSGHNVRDVLQVFMHNQRQVLNLWKEDVKAQVREHLDEKYPGQDLNIVAESFEIKLARAISETRIVAQGQSRGMRV
jgi:urease gamma subunit